MAFANFALDDPMPALMELPAALVHRFASRADETQGGAPSRLRPAK